MVDSIAHIASALESAKAITLEAAAIATSKLGESSYTHYSNRINGKQLRTLLNSRNPRDVKDAMKRIITLMSSGDSSIDTSTYFADVVKNITSDDIKIKRLIGVYLLRFAEKEPNLTLLCVNSLQKTSYDTIPETRAFAIRALSDIKIPSLYPMVLHTLKRVVTDPSPLVRSEVSFGIMKLFRSENDEFEEDLVTLIKDLLADTDPLVVSAAIATFNECYSQNLEWLHGHYRRYCKMLKALDPWIQATLINILVQYCKNYLPRPTLNSGSSTIVLPEREDDIPFDAYTISMHPDMSLFLTNVKGLIHHSNPEVIIACYNAFFQLSTSKEIGKSKFIEALVRITQTTTSDSLRAKILQLFLYSSSLYPALFQRHLKSFFLSPVNETVEIQCLKLNIISRLINQDNIKCIIKELKYYIMSFLPYEVITEAAIALSRCGQVSIEWEVTILNWFISLMEDNLLPFEVLESIVNIIRELVQLDPKKHLDVIIKLSNILQAHTPLADNARAGIIWLFGEVTSIEFKICPDLLRKLLANFVFEGPETRLQILLFAAKLLSCDIDRFTENNSGGEEYDLIHSRIAQMFNYVLYLSKADDDYDIRDRARCFGSIFESQKFEIATLLLQAPKPIPSLFIKSGKDNIEQIDVSIDKQIRNGLSIIPWNEDLRLEEDVDVRAEIPLKDYSKFKKS